MWSHEADGDVNSVVISSDGKYIVAGSADDKVYYFSRHTHTHTEKMKMNAARDVIVYDFNVLDEKSLSL